MLLLVGLLLVMVMLLLVLVMLIVVITAVVGAAEVRLIDKVMVLMVILCRGRRRGKSVSAEVVSRQVLTVIIGRGVIDMLCLVSAATFLLNKITKC